MRTLPITKTWEYWANDAKVKQCDFDPDKLNYSWSDRYVVFVAIDP